MAQVAKKLKKVEGQSSAQLELIPTNSHNPFWQSSLFNEVYLQNDVPVKFKEMWDFDEAGPFYEFCNQFRNLCEEIKDADLESWSERKTINNLIKPIFRMLGYTGTATQEPWAEDESFTVKENGELKTYKPDLIIVNDPKELKYIERKKGDEKLEEARSCVIVPVEAKYWGRIDDSRRNHSEDSKRSDKRDQADSTRALDFDEQCLKYMEILNKDFGILTDGKTWRLFNKDLSSDTYRRNYQFNLGHLIRHVNAGLDRSGRDYEVFVENAKYFFHFFSKSAFFSETGERRFLDDLLEYSKKYASRIEEDLKERFVKAMSFACNGFVQSADARKEKTDLAVIRNVAESHLFNILFIKHCESRNILPLKQSPEYRKISITNTIDKLEHFSPEKEEDNLNLPMLRRMFSKDFSYDPNGFELYERLLKLTKIVQEGASSKFDSFEVKGFKESIFSPEEWAFVNRHRICNSEMIAIYFELGYCESDIPGKKYQQIPYNFFSPRQLGSIYESFLEFRLERATEDMAFIKKQWVPANLSSQKVRAMDVPKVRKGRMFFTPDNKDRKVTGSYYTPDFVVQFIIQETLSPVVAGKKAKEIAATTICDPAMGSGHFLSAALNFLARAYLNLLADELNDDLDISLIDAKQLILHNCIYGIDMNPRAVKLAKMSLWLESAKAGSSLEHLNDQLICANSLVKKENPYLEFIDVKKEFKAVFRDGGFDAIVANPPYVVTFSDDERRYYMENYRSRDRELDTFVLFTERSLELIKSGGFLGQITSNTFLLQNSFQNVRKLLLESCQIKKLVDCGLGIFEDAVVPTAVQVYQKVERVTEDFEISVQSSEEFKSQGFFGQYRIIHQSSFASNGEFQFNLVPSKKEVLAEILGRWPKYGELFSIHEGVHSGNVRHKLFHDSKPARNPKKMIRGRDINKFSISWDGKWVAYDPSLIDRKKKEYASLRDEAIYSAPKIVSRQTAETIIAAVDLKSGWYSDNTIHCANPVIETLKQFNLEGKDACKYVCAILNSSVIDYLYRIIVQESGRVFPQVKIVRLNELPIPIPQKSALVQKLIRIVDEFEHNGNYSQERLDAIVFEIFDLSAKTKKEILDFLTSIKESKESREKGKRKGAKKAA